MARYNPRQERSLKRRSGYRDIKQSFLIICEGVNTEPDYFNAFRLTSVKPAVAETAFLPLLVFISFHTRNSSKALKKSG